jgi:Ca-activated chloride channel family protein
MEATSKILDDNKSKRLILFTDGAGQRDFSDEIRLAKGANIQISIYGVATIKGGVITDDDKLVKDKQGNIVITSLNENIKKLARDTNGKYLKYTISNSDMKSLSKSIIEKNKQTKDTNSTIIQSRELYYLPLIIALLALLYPFIGFRRER